MALIAETAKTRKTERPPAPPAPLVKEQKFTSRVEILEDFFSKPLPKITPRTRYFLSHLQRGLIYREGGHKKFNSLRKCCSRPIPGQVKNKKGEWVKTKSPGYVTVGDMSGLEGRPPDSPPFAFKWVQHCASSLLCFVCAPRLRSVRFEEIKEVCAAMWEKGYRWLFVTQTAPHYFDQEVGDQIKRFQKASSKLRSGRWWQDFAAEYAYSGQVRGTELTVPLKLQGSSGCHWHHHAIMFFKRETSFTEKEAEEIRVKLAARWVECLKAVGVEARTGWEDVEKFGLDVKAPEDDEDQGEVAALYVAKDWEPPAAKGAAWELAPPISSKNGRAAGRVSHWEFMARALLFGDEDKQHRTFRIMVALKGRHWLQFSKDIRLITGIKPKKDKDVLRETEETETIFEFDEDAEKMGIEWQKINKYKMQRDLLEAVGNREDLFVPLALTVCAGYHPKTGEPLETARQVENFLLLERLERAKPPGPPQ